MPKGDSVSIIEHYDKGKTIKITLFQQGASTTPAEGASLLQNHIEVF